MSEDLIQHEGSMESVLEETSEFPSGSMGRRTRSGYSSERQLMENMVLHMRLCHAEDMEAHPTVRSNDAAIDIAESEAGGDNSSLEVVRIPCQGCSCCSFPKHCKRSEFLYHRFLCPCDVDLADVGETTWLARSRELIAHRRLRMHGSSSSHLQFECGDSEKRQRQEEYDDVTDPDLNNLLDLLAFASRGPSTSECGGDCTSRIKGVDEGWHTSGLFRLKTTDHLSAPLGMDQNNSSSANYGNDLAQACDAISDSSQTTVGWGGESAAPNPPERPSFRAQRTHPSCFFPRECGRVYKGPKSCNPLRCSLDTRYRPYPVTSRREHSQYMQDPRLASPESRRLRCGHSIRRNRCQRGYRRPCGNGVWGKEENCIPKYCNNCAECLSLKAKCEGRISANHSLPYSCAQGYLYTQCNDRRAPCIRGKLHPQGGGGTRCSFNSKHHTPKVFQQSRPDSDWSPLFDQRESFPRREVRCRPAPRLLANALRLLVAHPLHGHVRSHDAGQEGRNNSCLGQPIWSSTAPWAYCGKDMDTSLVSHAIGHDNPFGVTSPFLTPDVVAENTQVAHSLATGEKDSIHIQRQGFEFSFAPPDVALAVNKHESLQSLALSRSAPQVRSSVVSPGWDSPLQEAASPRSSAANEALVRSQIPPCNNVHEGFPLSAWASLGKVLAQSRQGGQGCVHPSHHAFFNTVGDANLLAEVARASPITNSSGRGELVGTNQRATSPQLYHHSGGVPCSQQISGRDRDTTSNNNNSDHLYGHSQHHRQHHQQGTHHHQQHVKNNSCNVPQPPPPPSSSSHSQGRRQLRGRVVRVEGDGRCLFRSLVTAEWSPLQAGYRDEFGRPLQREMAEQETVRADQLRARVVALMSDNLHFYSQLERGVINADQPLTCNYQRFRDRLTAMSEPTTMPGDLELNAVALVMERQILVLDTDLAVITSYGHDRFPQSPPLAVRYTRLVEDVGHYDAVILQDSSVNVFSQRCDLNSSSSVRHLDGSSSITAAASVEQAKLCGDFRKLTTSSGKLHSGVGVGAKGRCIGDATLNAKKEFFYLRLTDKALHSEGLEPVVDTPKNDAASPLPPEKEQRTAEATTSTVQPMVHWPPGPSLARSRPCKDRRTRRAGKARRPTLSNKHTQTDDEDGARRWRPARVISKPARKRCRYQRTCDCELIKPKTSTARGKQGAGLTNMVGGGGQFKFKPRRTALVDECGSVVGHQNVNWNSRSRGIARKPGLTARAQCVRYCRTGCPRWSLDKPCSGAPLRCKWARAKGCGAAKPCRDERPMSFPRFKPKSSRYLLTKSVGKTLSNETATGKTSASKAQALRNGLNTKSPTFVKYIGRRRGLDVSTNSSAVKSRRKVPTTYINNCAPTVKKPRVEKPETKRSRSSSHPSRRRKSVGGSGKGRVPPPLRPGSPVNPRPPCLLPPKGRLPEDFEAPPCRCVLCNAKMELSPRESVQCYLCGRMAHRACVMKDSPGRGQGGGDHNYFLCPFCVPL